MRETSPPSPAVVVGIDGSQGAIEAALWAIDEAVERDLPLRLVYAIEPRESAAETSSLTHDFVTAEAAVRYASMAIESAEKPVKLEVEIVQDRALTTLVAASRSAAMVCVGPSGFDAARGARAGSMVADLVALAHSPVVIVSQSSHVGSEIVCLLPELHGTSDHGSLVAYAVAEALLRSAPLRVLARWQPDSSDVRGNQESAASGRATGADLERIVTPCRTQHPELTIQTVAVLEDPIDYLARHIDSIGLIVLGHRPGEEPSELAGGATHAAVSDLNCSVLICERHSAP